jgi:hypothetical protein
MPARTSRIVSRLLAVQHKLRPRRVEQFGLAPMSDIPIYLAHTLQGAAGTRDERELALARRPKDHGLPFGHIVEFLARGVFEIWPETDDHRFLPAGAGSFMHWLEGVVGNLG